MSEDFRSPLASEMASFVAYKRARGYVYRRAAATLKSFDRYIEANSESPTSRSLPNLLRQWLCSRSHRKSVSVAVELGTIRQFLRYRLRFHEDGFVPGREWAPQSVESEFVPEVLSEDQIHALLAEADCLRCDLHARPAMRALILILYCTGLRFGEAIRLRIRDVDTKNRLFRILESKGKTRWVPFRADLLRELRKYRSHRDRLAPAHADAPFFVRPDGKAFSVKGASGILRGMLRRRGFKPLRGRVGPRPYDLRHTFAVHRLIRWHRAGIDVHRRLPHLSAYLGHNDIMGTEVYLNATPELLKLASHRLRTRLLGEEAL